MKIYLAGGCVSPPKDNKKIQKLFHKNNKLHSYFHAKDEKKGLEGKWFHVNIKNKVNIFLDSGAFSALTQGIEIDINQYIDFIKKHLDVLEVYANLDFIPGKNTASSKKISAEKTLQNQRIMEEAGLSPLPCFHVGEPLEYLEYYIKNYDYIALGGMVGKQKSTLIPWLDMVFGKFICDKNGMPKVKVHGFGLTSLPLMLRYPWYSVDSTSWVMTGRTGSIYVPRYRNGKWAYDENPWVVAVSSRSPGKAETGKHIDTFSPKQRDVILDYIHSKGYKLGKSRFEKFPQDHELGKNERWAEKKPKNKKALRLLEIIEEDGIANRYQLRDEMNIIYFQDLEKTIPEWPWAFKLNGLQGFSL